MTCQKTIRLLKVEWNSQALQAHGHGRNGRGRGVARGQIRGTRGRCTRIGGTSRGHQVVRQSGQFTDSIPPCTQKIEERDVRFREHDEFNPQQMPEPQSLLDNLSGLDIFSLYFDDEILELLVTSTKLMQLKKEEKPAMYRRFKQSTLSKQEMLRFIGVLILTSVNSVRSYWQAWNPKSSQVGFLLSSSHTSFLFHIIIMFIVSP